MLREGDGPASCLYSGTVVHRRSGPLRHEFRYRLSLMFLNLAELPELRGLAPLWGYEKRAPLSFRREDHVGEPSIPVEQSVRDLVRSRTGLLPTGPICLLTSPRLFGYGFNPISFYFCYGNDGRNVEHVVAEVTNTPWLERHCYVLTVPDERRGLALQQFVSRKAMHVSPFLEMDHSYRWRLHLPTHRFSARIENWKDDRKLFVAAMNLERQPLGRAALARNMVAPLGAFRVVAAIHYQALRLWWKGVPFVPHPRGRDDAVRQPSPLKQRFHSLPEEQNHDERHRAA